MNWHPLRVESGFLKTIGSIEWCKQANESLKMRFRVEPIHCNPVGSCHGGMLATFADIVLGFSVGHSIGDSTFTPTIELKCDFLAPAQSGRWVISQAEILRSGKAIGVARCVMITDMGETVAHASGIFKVDRRSGTNYSHSDFLYTDT